MKAALYARVSTTDQDKASQLRELHRFLDVRGWTLAREYVDTCSGARAKRPQLDLLMQDAMSREFDVVVCWKLDRFGRSLMHCVSAIHQLEASGVRFVASSQGIDTDESNPAAKFMLHVLAACAEFERELIRERVKSGRARYEEDMQAGRIGTELHSRSGKDLPAHRPRKIFNRDRVFDLKAEGLSLREIAARLKLSLGTVARTLQGRSKSCYAAKETASSNLNDFEAAKCPMER